MSTALPLLHVERASVRYTLRGAGLLAPARTLDALSDVSIEIREGGRLGVVGESGSGKSTLARVVLGLVRAQAGRVAWEGRTVDYDDATAMRSLRREMQVVFQDPFGSLDPRMTAGQAIGEALQALAGPVASVAAQDRIHAALSEVGLASAFANRYPHEMSGGQCQRVAIARAIVARPRLLVCDEVVSALDVSVQAQIVNLLHELSERYQMSLLFISHNLAVVRHLCDDVAVLCQGRMVEQGSRDAIFGNPQAQYTRDLLAAVPEPDPVLQRARIALAGNASRTMPVVAACSVSFLARGKADTRARKATGYHARLAAPGSFPPSAGTTHGARGIDDPDRIRRTTRASRWPAGERHRALTVGSCDQLDPAGQLHSMVGLGDHACAVRRFRSAENVLRRGPASG